MKTHIVILSSVPSEERDQKFLKLIQGKYEFWRYNENNWILLTPNDVSSKIISDDLVAAYGVKGFTCVMEILLLDFVAVIPQDALDSDKAPVAWFGNIVNKSFVPVWERGKHVNEG